MPEPANPNDHGDGLREEPAMPVAAESDAATIHKLSARKTRRSFLVGGVLTAAAAFAWNKLWNAPQRGRLQVPLRNVINTNTRIDEWLSRDESALAPTYPVSRAIPLRPNGVIGLDQEIVPAQWRLQLVGVRNASASPKYVADVTAWQYGYAGDNAPSDDHDLKTAPKARLDAKSAAKPASQLDPSGAHDSAAGEAVAAKFAAMNKDNKRNHGDDEAGASYSSLDIGTPGLLLTLDDLAQLPVVDFVTEFKCIEGWSNITHWRGYRLRDLLAMYPPELRDGREPGWVYIETPDGDYYGSYSLAAARHPQSLLVTHMHGEPLTQQHGAPLRLHMPIKYGYKQVKRIGLIAYSWQQPDDYWSHLGYDPYAGL